MGARERREREKVGLKEGRAGRQAHRDEAHPWGPEQCGRGVAGQVDVSVHRFVRVCVCVYVCVLWFFPFFYLFCSRSLGLFLLLVLFSFIFFAPRGLAQRLVGWGKEWCRLAARRVRERGFAPLCATKVFIVFFCICCCRRLIQRKGLSTFGSGSVCVHIAFSCTQAQIGCISLSGRVYCFLLVRSSRLYSFLLFCCFFCGLGSCVPLPFMYCCLHFPHTWRKISIF